MDKASENKNKPDWSTIFDKQSVAELERAQCALRFALCPAKIKENWNIVQERVRANGWYFSWEDHDVKDSEIVKLRVPMCVQVSGTKDMVMDLLVRSIHEPSKKYLQLSNAKQWNVSMLSTDDAMFAWTNELWEELGEFYAEHRDIQNEPLDLPLGQNKWYVDANGFYTTRFAKMSVIVYADAKYQQVTAYGYLLGSDGSIKTQCAAFPKKKKASVSYIVLANSCDEEQC